MMLFEGPEKKLEILTAAPFPSLRTLGDEFWQSVVERAGARIISGVSTDACDAHLLSESSLFVCDRRAVMITCGKTTLIQSALELVERIPDADLASLIYERKNENFPELQQTNFEEDVARLTARVAGTSLIIGDPSADHVALFHLDRQFEPDSGDATLEVLMYDLEPRVSRLFTAESTTRELRDRIGLEAMFPGFLFDDHLFDPTGYSFNGVKGEYYSTLHVTPQRRGSYTSFETNYRLDGAEVRDVVSQVISFFQPARSDVLLFQSPLDLRGLPDGFRATPARSMRLGCGYKVAYSHIERETARGRIPSI
jgi:S-adenosylmethionine decarboxylase